MSTNNKTVPPVPYKVAMTDNSGFLTSAWSAWFRQVFVRVGGAVALSNVELENLQEGSLSTIAADIATLQGQVTSLTNLLAADMNDLSQGRQL